MWALFHEVNMQLILSTPLRIETAMDGELEVVPVHMNVPSLHANTAAWHSFLKKDGRRIPVSRDVSYRISAYMSKHDTSAVSEDGVTAYTVAGNFLLECLPHAVTQPEICEA